MIFGIKEKWIILTHELLAFATNIPVPLMTGFVVQVTFDTFFAVLLFIKIYVCLIG